MFLIETIFSKMLLKAILPFGFIGTILPILSGMASLFGGKKEEKSGGGLLGDLLPSLIQTGGGLLGGLLGGKEKEDMYGKELAGKKELMDKEQELAKDMFGFRKEQASEFRPQTERYESYGNLAPMDEMIKKLAMGMMGRDTEATGGAMDKYGIDMKSMMERMFKQQPREEAPTENTDVVAGGRPEPRRPREDFFRNRRRRNPESGSGRFKV